MLSTTSAYALRALGRLAQEPPGTSLLGRVLAREAHVPEQYLPKLMHPLRHAGLVGSTRGTGGGYRLERAANQIRLLEVVEVFDGPLGRPFCLLGMNPRCTETNSCPAHSGWKKVREEFVQFLTQTTISDLSVSAPGRFLESTEHGPGGQP